MTISLLTPKIAQEGQKTDDNGIRRDIFLYALEAPKTPYYTLKEYAEAVARETKINPWKFKRLIKCESNWKETALGDNGRSFGILQFKEKTFEHFAEKYGFRELEIRNPYHQIDLAALMIKNGYLYHWENCAGKAGWNDQL